MLTTLDRATAWVSDVAWLNRVLGGDAAPSIDPLSSVRVDRIGEGFGLSGVVHRLSGITVTGSPVRLVAKVESADKIRNATAVRRHIEPALGSSIPRCYGSWIEPGEKGHALGVILLEDIHPAVQGDELDTMTRAQVEALTTVVRRLHDIPVPHEPGVQRWRPRRRDPALWADRLDALRSHHRSEFTAERWDRLRELETESHLAAVTLAEQPTRWIHVDPHFDNVMWRRDGSAVLLDWSNARLGPIELDVIVLMLSACWSAKTRRSVEEVLGAYAGAHRASDLDQFRSRLASACIVQVRGTLGWLAGAHESELHPRDLALRMEAFGRVNRALDWVDSR